MKTTFATISFLMISIVCLSQNLLNHPESVVYDSSNNRYLVSNWEDGNIIQIDSAEQQDYFNQELSSTASLHVVADLPLSGNCQSDKEFSKLETTVLSATGEIVKLFGEESKIIWPGFDLSKQPFIIYIPEKWTMIVNCNKKISGFVPYPKEWPDIFTDAIIHFGKYKDLTGQLAFSYEIDSIKTVAIGFPEDYYTFEDDIEKIKIFAFIIHESFHQYQRQSFGEIPWSREEKYPILDIENTASAYMEILLLLDALQAMDTDDRNKCQKLLNEFAAVRKNRWNNADNFVRKYEQGQELNEGTAKYVEVKSIIKMVKKANKSDPDINPDFLNSFQSEEISNYLINDFNKRITGNTISPEDMMRNRIYPVGAAQGILLDYLGKDWKKEAEKAGSEFTLFQAFSNDSINGNDNYEILTTDARKEYNYDDIIFSTKRSIGDNINKYEKELSSFKNQDGIKIEISFKYFSLSRSRSSKAKKWVMKNGKQSLCTNYRIFKLKTKNILINLQNLGVLQYNEWNNKYTKIVFYADSALSVILDSNEYDISNASNSQFSKIKIVGKDIDVSYNLKGQINVSENCISIAQESE